MVEPSDALRQLAAQGRQLRVDIIQHARSKRASPRNVVTGVDFLDAFFNLAGYKRTAVRIGKALVEDQSAKRGQELSWKYQEWSSAVRKELSGISEIRPKLTLKGNSDTLLNRFATSQNFYWPESKLAHGVQFLEMIAERKLVRNEHLAEVVRPPSRPLPSVTEARLPLPGFLGSSEESTMAMLQTRFPVEYEAIRGAMSVYSAKGPDWGRQALGSCRNCLENLVRRLSGEGEWSAGLEKLISSEAHRRTIRQVYAHLCAYGSHGPELPSQTVVEMGIGLTIVAVRSILSTFV